MLFKVLAIAYRKETFFTFQNIIINCLVPLNVLGEVCAIKRGAGGGYNISEQQLFEALKMNYTGDSFICLQIHFYIKLSSEEVKKRTCRGNDSREQMNRA